MTDVRDRKPSGKSAGADSDQKMDVSAERTPSQEQINTALQTNFDRLLSQSQVFDRLLQAALKTRGATETVHATALAAHASGTPVSARVIETEPTGAHSSSGDHDSAVSVFASSHPNQAPTDVPAAQVSTDQSDTSEIVQALHTASDSSSGVTEPANPHSAAAAADVPAAPDDSKEVLSTDQAAAGPSNSVSVATVPTTSVSTALQRLKERSAASAALLSATLTNANDAAQSGLSTRITSSSTAMGAVDSMHMSKEESAAPAPPPNPPSPPRSPLPVPPHPLASPASPSQSVPPSPTASTELVREAAAAKAATPAPTNAKVLLERLKLRARQKASVHADP
jgi:hypothetical protein